MANILTTFHTFHIGTASVLPNILFQNAGPTILWRQKEI